MDNNVVNIDFFSKGGGRPRLVPEMLLEARKAVGITQTELASRVQLTRQAISAFELGSKQPEGTTLSRIAETLGQPLAFFTSAHNRELFGPLSARTYRAFGAPTKKRNDQCDVLTRWSTQIACYISKFVNFPESKVPDLDLPTEDGSIHVDDIDHIAELVRTSWGLGLGPIGNLTKLLESRGVFVVDLPVSAGKVNAFSYWSGAVPFIVLGSDTDTSAVRRRFDLAHELGHLVLHRGIGEEELQDNKKLKSIEAEANRFAGAFLLPSRSYPNEVFSTRLESFVSLKSRWKVAVSAQVYRCSDLGILDDRQILNLRKQISSRKWRTKEPLDDVLEVEQPSMLKNAARLAVNGGALSPTRLYTDLRLRVDLLARSTGISSSEMLRLSAETEPALFVK